MTPGSPRVIEETSDAREPGRCIGAGLRQILVMRLFTARQCMADESLPLPLRAMKARADVQRASALLKLWKKKLGPAHAAAVARFKAASRHLALLEAPEKAFRRSTTSDFSPEIEDELAEIASLLRRCEVDGVVLVASLVEPEDLEKALKKARQKAKKRFADVEDHPDHANLERLRRTVRAESALVEAAETHFNGIDTQERKRLETLELLLDRSLGTGPAGTNSSPSSRKAAVRDVLELGCRIYGLKKAAAKRPSAGGG
ncbi:hypothetical protein GR183_16380 [Stappia sp. GBMRC 2046]|uniref:CHAD domain-containing protein n=1 Tax=Stappia sediminis TaxID=2692190 RepID=A0A7X3S953_9HYPH|nr:hypothetical protein [Stappia sediminis]MXN66494.1 hypothetical protein [Stappia sediminis]